MFKFGQKEVTAIDFYGQRQITDIFTIDVNKVSCNNGKNYRYIVGYQVDEALIPLLSRRLKIYLVMVCHNMIKTLPLQFHSMYLRKRSAWLNTKKFGG